MKKILFALFTLTLSIINLHGNENNNVGPYVGGFGGTNFFTSPKYSGAGQIQNTGLAGGFALGYKFENNIRGEVEFSCRYNPFQIKRSLEYVRLDSTVYAIMGNVYYDLPTIYGFTPYLGAGLGAAWRKSQFKFEHKKATLTEENNAYQGIVGISRKAWESADLGLEYRQFYFKDRRHDHAVLVSLKQYF